MAKNSVRDFDATAANNTDIQSVDIAENCAPSGINNAIRELMADIKDVSTGTIALESPQADSLTVTGDLTVDTNTLYVDSTNNRVGVGTSSPSTVSGFTVLEVAGSSNGGFIQVTNGTVNNSFYNSGNVGFIGTQTNHSLGLVTNGAERMRIDSSGNLLVGVTSTTIPGVSNTTAGVSIRGDDGSFFSRSLGSGDTNSAVTINRTTSAGNILSFNKDGVQAGVIGVDGRLGIGTGDTGLYFNDTLNFIGPLNAGTLAYRDNAIDLGYSAYRFDDIYATNGTIQTSDQNEKQQIASLTTAEITAAKAISKLFKTFKWNDSVDEKGDAARTHAGVIAQDVQQAMTDAGLDAGDYAFFISSTWWETQTEVPAVEAVDAVDAVYEDVVIPAVEEQLDDEGNVIVEAQPERTEQRLVSEAVEAVEAQDAYTRTDTYDTAEEAPAGATERTRLGIRYPELLAFVGAATEQRLADIETRLTALEA